MTCRFGLGTWAVMVTTGMENAGGGATLVAVDEVIIPFWRVVSVLCEILPQNDIKGLHS